MRHFLAAWRHPPSRNDFRHSAAARRTTSVRVRASGLKTTRFFSASVVISPASLAKASWRARRRTQLASTTISRFSSCSVSYRCMSLASRDRCIADGVGVFVVEQQAMVGLVDVGPRVSAAGEHLGDRGELFRRGNRLALAAGQAQQPGVGGVLVGPVVVGVLGDRS